MIAGRNDDALRRFIFLVGHVAVSIRQLGNDAVDLAVSILGEHVAALVIIEPAAVFLDELHLAIARFRKGLISEIHRADKMCIRDSALYKIHFKPQL